MNNKGQNIMLNILFFMIALAVVIMFISPIKTFTDIAQQSDSLNCRGYIHNGNSNAPLSYNSSLNSDTLACLGLKLYLPYILLVFLIGGVSKILYGRAQEFVGAEEGQFD